MKARDCDGFREGGEYAWWQGLRDAIRFATDRLKTARSEEERTEAQAELERLKAQQAHARRNGGRRLF